ncbi:TIGR03759 family integrating conjugative element protein [Vibrio sp. TBV020]|uniref:TIGR03759 family integrating conjugative element protein n=1 Tax=Vibrio sp. TBV020 TaxID=3137398 RepID=UPI0038CDBEBB
MLWSAFSYANVVNTQHSSTVMAKQWQGSDWDITDEQWQRYQRLMQTPLTYDMQDATPLEVLAIFARHDAERDALAKQLVEFDKKRTEGLLALDVAYRQAWKTQYPNLSVVGNALPERVVLFVSSQCDDCLDALKAWRSQGVSVDVYLVDGQGNDRKLRAWAAKAGIRQADVTDKHITLNHDKRGLWFNLAKGQPAPVAMAARGEQWVVVSLP